VKKGVLAQYKDYLPVTPATPMLTIGEGDTPLVRSDRLAARVGCAELYLKFEGCNPTGSFKDRGMVVAVAKAIEEGSKAIICASTGNTSASAAAYAAQSGLDCIIVIPGGKIALGKLAQAIVYGARIVSVDGNFDQALAVVREMSEKHPVVLVTPTASRARRPPRSRLSILSAGRRTSTPCRSAMPGTSPPTGRAIKSITRKGSRNRFPRCTVSRPRAPRLS